MGHRVWLAVALACAALLPARAQEARWYQLSEQVVQLNQQGKAAEALPLAQEAVRVAQATWGAEDRHLGLSLNVLGVLETDLEKFSDAGASLQQALGIMVKASGAESKDTATVLDNLGNLDRSEGKYADAEKFTAEALAIHEKVLGPNDANVSTDASNLALIDEAEGKYTDAEPLYQRAIAIDEKLGSADLAADLNGLGQLYIDMGRDSDAEAAFLRATALDVKALGKDHPQIALDLQNLGASYLYQGKFAGAESIFARALQIAEAGSPPNAANAATVAQIEENMGALYRDEGKYANAEAMLLRALANRTKALGADHPDVAAILDNLGSLYAYEMRYSDAESAYRQAIAIRAKRLGPMHPLTALSMINLANLYSEHGRWGDAEAMYRNAMTVYLKVYGQADARVAGVLASAGDLMLNEGKLADAERVLAGAVAIYEKAKGQDSTEVAGALNLLAQVYEAEGKHEQAEAAYKRAIEIGEKAGNEKAGGANGASTNSAGLAVYLIGLATVYRDEQRFAEAEPLLLRAMKILEGSLRPDDPALGDAVANLAVLYYAWGKPEQAAPYFDRRLENLMDQFRANAATMSERDRLIFFATTPGAFPMFFSFVLKYHDRNPELTGKMYDALLAEKGFIAESAAAMRAAVEASGDKEALMMLDKLTGDKAQLAALVESTVGDAANRRQQIAQLQQEANTLEQELMQRSAALSQQRAMGAVTWRDVQKSLKPGEAAVEVTRFQFHDGMTFTANFVYAALMVTPESKSPEFVLLGDAKDLEAAPMMAYRADVGQTRGFEAEATPAAPGQAAGVANTSAAYAAFWKPLEAALGGAKRIYIAADGVLNQIPIGLMADSAGKLVMEKYQLRIVNSTKDLLRVARVAQAKSAVLVGNPKFDLTAAEERAALAELSGGGAQTGAGDVAAGQQANQAPAATADMAQVASRGGELKGGDLNPLPGTQVEVDAVDKLLKNAGWQAAMYTGNLALKDAVTRVRSPRVVHIATHGFFLTDQELAAQAGAQGEQHTPIEDPMLRSGLFFAGADRVRAGAAPAAGVDDGVLTAYEASQLNLEGTELVVLSACETGLGEQSNSEGVFGLRRGLQEAGADAVMMSMWSVPDKETQELMALFYAKWLAGTDKAEALRQAQLQEREAVRQRYGKDLPFYWGAFVLVGR